MIFHTNHPWTDSPHPICATFQGAPRSSKACSQRLHFSQADMALLKPRSRKAMRKWRPFHGHFMGIGLMEKNKSINQYLYIYIVYVLCIYICVCIHLRRYVINWPSFANFAASRLGSSEIWSRWDQWAISAGFPEGSPYFLVKIWGFPWFPHHWIVKTEKKRKKSSWSRAGRAVELPPAAWPLMTFGVTRCFHIHCSKASARFHHEKC